MELIYTLPEIKQAARLLWESAGEGAVVALHGSMGAGKTTLVHALCENLGVKEAVGSPTFSLINHYTYPQGSLYHIDLYRLAAVEDALRAGVEEVLLSGEACIVEWPDRAASLFPEHTLHVYLETLGDLKRKMTIRASEIP